ncbi:MAG: hypothetical protein K2N05_11425 [Muribaculaceae bacterium]|nr:hypothetical protein [Muribaculaceae bacterium]
MRKGIINIFVTLCLLSGIVFTGCHKSNDNTQVDPSGQPEASNGTPTKSDSGKKLENDSIDAGQQAQQTQQIKVMTESLDSIVKKISTMDDKLNQLEEKSKELETLSTELNNLKDKLTIVQILGIGLGLLGLLAALFAIVGCVSQKAKIKQQADDIKELRFKLSNIKSGKNYTGNYLDTTHDYSGLERRIAKIEGTLKVMPKTNPSTSENKIDKPMPDRPTQSKPMNEEIKAYFGNPIQGPNGSYFRKALEHRDSDARFFATIKGNTASFKPIMDNDAAKKTILSSDNMQHAIDISGSGSDVISVVAGRARKEDNDWIIIEKAKVIVK